MKKNTVYGIIAGVVAGAIAVCSLPAVAKNIEVAINSVNIKLNGEWVCTTDENYELQNGTKVPYSILYEGTTYLPIRKVSELLNVGIDWDNDTRTVLVENKGTGGAYDSWYGAPDFGEFYDIQEVAQSPTVRSTTHWYEVKNVNKVTEYTDYLEELGYTRVTTGNIKPKFKVYKKGNIEVWLDLGMYTKMVYGVTVMDTTRPICSREYSYSGSNEDIPNFGTAFGYESKNIGGIQYYIGDWSLWASLPDYFSLLDEEGFKVSNVDNGYYGKCITLKKNRTAVVIKYDGTEYSTLPAISIDY